MSPCVDSSAEGIDHTGPLSISHGYSSPSGVADLSVRSGSTTYWFALPAADSIALARVRAPMATWKGRCNVPLPVKFTVKSRSSGRLVIFSNGQRSP